MKFSFKNQAKSGRGPDRKIVVVSGCVLVLIGIVAAALYLAGGLSQTKSAQSASSGSEPTDLAPHQGSSSTDSARVSVTKAPDAKLPGGKALV